MQDICFACHCSYSVFNSTPSSLFFFVGLSKSFSSSVENRSRECSKARKRIAFSASLSFSAEFGRRFGSLLCELSGFGSPLDTHDKEFGLTLGSACQVGGFR